jgi:hypothetical protein
MKVSWRRYFRRIAAVLLVGGATAWSSAYCYAAQLAYDSASDPVYADGWQGAVTNMTPTMGPGDNGGFGFKPWNFDNDTLFHVEGIRDINGPPNQSSFNQVGTSWRLGLNYLDDPEAKDIVRVGRGLTTPLQIGQTLSIIVDTPTDTAFFDIETITLNTGGGNLCYGGAACTSGTAPKARFQWSYFNWLDMDDWGRWSATSLGATTLFNTDKVPNEHPDFPAGAAGTDTGLRLDFTLTGAEAFSLTATPLDDPSKVFTGSGTLENPGTGPIDWIGFLHYGEESNDGFPTDFYIRSLEITGAAAATGDFDNDGDVDGADFLRWQRGLGMTSGAVLGNGDADGDGDVDAADLTVWKQKFGQPAAAGSAVSAPEPVAIVYWVMGAAALAGRGLASRQRR